MNKKGRTGFSMKLEEEYTGNTKGGTWDGQVKYYASQEYTSGTKQRSNTQEIGGCASSTTKQDVRGVIN